MPSKELFNECEGLNDLQELIAYCARVSNPTNQHNTETSEKLIGYLIRHKHWSPLEMADATIEIETTRDISHQMVRHRSFCYQEFSQRYSDPTEESSALGFVFREARLQDKKNRQNSIDINLSDEYYGNLQVEWERRQQAVINQSLDAYHWAINNGLAKEQARAVLPEGLTKTKLYAKASIRSWIHYIEIRAAKETQKEHRYIARGCAEEIAKIFPMINSFIKE
jgi:thymidylate synthase (FAD)